MSLLFDPDELALFLGEEFDDDDRRRAELFIRITAGEIRAFCGHAFEEVAGGKWTFDGNGSDLIVLPNAWISAVHSITERLYTGGVRTMNGPDVVPPLLPEYEWSAKGILRRLTRGTSEGYSTAGPAIWVNRFRWYTLDYDHGFIEIPEAVHGVALRVAARGFDNPTNVRQETFGRYARTLAGEAAGIGLFGPDQKDLAPWRLESRDLDDGTTTAGS